MQKPSPDTYTWWYIKSILNKQQDKLKGGKKREKVEKPKICTESHKTPNSQRNPEQKDEVWDTSVSDFKECYKAIVTMEVDKL